MATTVKKTRKPPQNAIQLTVWMMHGGPMPEEAQDRIERAVEATLVDLFNEEDLRLLTQTNKG